LKQGATMEINGRAGRGRGVPFKVVSLAVMPASRPYCFAGSQFPREPLTKQ